MPKLYYDDKVFTLLIILRKYLLLFSLFARDFLTLSQLLRFLYLT